MSRVPQVTTQQPSADGRSATDTAQRPSPFAGTVHDPDLHKDGSSSPGDGRNILLTLGGAVPFRGGQHLARMVRWFPAAIFVASLLPLTLLLMNVIPQEEWPDSLPVVVILAATAIAHSTVLLVRFAQGFLDFGKSDQGDDDRAAVPVAEDGTARPARSRSGSDRFRVSLSMIGGSPGQPARRPAPSADELRRTIRWSRYEHAAQIIYLVGGLGLLWLEAVHHM